MNSSRIHLCLRVGGAAAALLLLLALAMGIARMTQMRDAWHTIMYVNNTETKLIAAMRESVSDRMIALRNVALVEDMAALQHEVGQIDAGVRKYAQAEQTLRAMFFSPAGSTAEEKALLFKLSEADAALRPLIAKILEQGRARKGREAARVLLREVGSLQKKWLDSLAQLQILENRLNEQAVRRTEQHYADALLALLLLVALICLFGGGIGIWFMRREPAQTDNPASLKAMRDSLSAGVAQIGGATGVVATASGRVAAFNQDLSARSAQQASALQATAGAIAELAAGARQNAGQAQQAGRLAASALDVAVKSGTGLAQARATMGALDAASGQATELVNAIDAIAFESNLLAQKAAHACADRPGDAFAPLAGEMCVLAGRSADAARELTLLIAATSGKIDAGSKLLEQAGGAMEQFATSVRQAGSIIAEVGAASARQEAEIVQLHQTIAAAGSAGGQHALLALQAGDAAESLCRQAGRLIHVVDACAQTILPPAVPHGAVIFRPAFGKPKPVRNGAGARAARRGREEC